jgi:hypothetical protein
VELLVPPRKPRRVLTAVIPVCDNDGMLDLSLLDAAVLLYVLLLVARSGSRQLGESLHDLIALLLVVGLFLGFRMAREVRGLLSGVAELMQAIPGLGTRILIIVGAWYLMRLIRQQSASWIEQAVPGARRKGLTRISEGSRALLLAGFLVWLAEGLFDEPPATVPAAVTAVRTGEAWVTRWLRPAEQPPTAATAPHPRYSPPSLYPPYPAGPPPQPPYR